MADTQRERERDSLTHTQAHLHTVHIMNDAFIICCKLLRTIMMMSGHVPGRAGHTHTHMATLHTHTRTLVCSAVALFLSWHLALIAA